MEKLDMQSMDVTAANVEKIAALFPSCVTERLNSKGVQELAIDFDKLRMELGADVLDETEERYQFTWPDKREAIRLSNARTTMTLRPCREESVDFDNTENLYIEGDNLEVLKALQQNYLGKIKMIYIDPPYNTGGDFIYKDKRVIRAEVYKNNSGQYDAEGNQLVKNTESNGRFHTDWLNFMYPRLKVARTLLSDDGVILLNMDENEITNLQKLCSEIFGENNDLGTIVWDKRNPKGDAKGISYQHEYILVYAKNILTLTGKCKILRPKKNAEMMIKKANSLFAKISSSYSLDDANSDFSKWLSNQEGLSGGERAYNKIDENGKLYRPVSMAWPNKKQAPEEYFIPLIHPITGKACPVPERGWRNPPATMKDLLAKGLILFGKDETTQPNRKYILEENMFENIPSLLYYGGSDVDMLSKLDIPFDTPKVVSICSEHINSFTDEDDIILDFFSGSATNAHAVMQLNAESKSKRKYIMVQIPELTDKKSEAYKKGFLNLCEIGKERIRRAGAIIKADNPNVDAGFRVLKLAESNMKDVYYTPGEVQEQDLWDSLSNIKEDRTPEDLLFQVMPECGVKFSEKIEVLEISGKKVFSVMDNYLAACFDEKVNEDVITAIAKTCPTYFVMRDSSLDSDNVADNFMQIFKQYSPETTCKII